MGKGAYLARSHICPLPERARLGIAVPPKVQSLHSGGYCLLHRQRSLLSHNPSVIGQETTGRRVADALSYPV